MQPRLLIVDDDLEMREVLAGLFSSAGLSCEVAADAKSALSLVDAQTFDTVVSDVVMEGMSGLQLLDQLRVSRPSLPVVLLTGAGGIPQAVDAMKRGAFGYVLKPYDVDEVERIVKDAIDARMHSRESLRVGPIPTGDGSMALVGEGPAMRELRSAIALVARSSAPVLVTGETGAGKELVARAIHAQSARSARPFVAVNTSAIPQELLEGEIFGHVRGGFTGAVQARKGLMTEADGGTLLLDEIGDMPLALQAKLLRVLQTGDVRPVGSDRVHHVDVRIIASTHRDLPALVQEGRFRQDLYFRLNVLPVRVPRLSDHLEDIPALAEHFLAEARGRAPGSPVRSLGADALRALSERAWPGNVRELGSAIERAVVFGVGERADERHLSVAPLEGTGSWPFPAHAPWPLARLSREYALWVLGRTGGDKRKASEIMGIDQSTIYRWLRKPQD